LTFEFVGFDPEKGQQLFDITKDQPQRAFISVKTNLLDNWGDYTLKVKVSTYFERNSYINLVHKLMLLL